MPIPDFQSLTLPVLVKLAESRVRTKELVSAMADQFGLTEAERAALLPSGRQATISNRVHWAVAYLNKAGLIARIGRGEYAATPAGQTLLMAPPAKITLAFLMQHYPGVRAFRGDGVKPSDDSTPAVVAATESIATVVPEATPDDVISLAVGQIETKVRDDLLGRLLDMPPAFFEKVVIDLLLAMGYGSTAEDAGEALGGSGDGGVDGVIREDRLGLDLIYVQAKRYRDAAISSDQLRSFAGALDDKGARKGVFITTSRFTADARGFAARQQMKRIVLVDGEMLTRLMLRHDVGVRTDRTITLKRVDLEYFEPEGD